MNSRGSKKKSLTKKRGKDQINLIYWEFKWVWEENWRRKKKAKTRETREKNEEKDLLIGMIFQ